MKTLSILISAFLLFTSSPQDTYRTNTFSYGDIFDNIYNNFEYVINGKKIENNTISKLIDNSIYNDRVEIKSVIPIENTKFDANYTLQIIKELTDPKYEGKKSGTEGYKNAIYFLKSKFSEKGLVPIFEDDLIQEYNASVANMKKSYLAINGSEIELMEDYMPFSRTAEGKYNGTREIVFLGSGISNDYKGINVNDKSVIFSWLDSNGEFPSGTLDRVLMAKKRGAKEVFVICNGDFKVGNYEHPIRYENTGIYVQYISENIAKNLGIDDYENKKSFEAEIEYDLDIERNIRIKSQNIVGKIPGVYDSKSILLVTNLDGFGKLPGGYIYQNAKYSSVSPALMLSIVEYYNKNKPLYDIYFAVVGNKWDTRQGIKYVMGNIDEENFIGAIDLYSMGGQVYKPYLGITKNADKDFTQNFIRAFGGSINYDLGNSLADVIDDYIDNTIIIRDDSKLENNLKKDTWQNVNKDVLIDEFSLIKDIINEIITSEFNKEKYIYKMDREVVYNEVAERYYNRMESKYFTILFDDRYIEKVMNKNLLRECDKIYERISRFNYYPKVEKKPTIIFSMDTVSAAKIGGRTDLYQGNYNVGGGFASFNGVPTEVIYCRGPGFYTLSHELNHLIASKKVGNIGFTNQEAQGQNFNIYYRGMSFLYDENRIEEIVNQADPIIEDKDQIYVAKTYKDRFNWNWLFDGTTNPYKHQNSYFTLGSMYSFLNYNYGYNTARRAIYRVYESKDRNDLKKAVIYDTKLTEEEFLEEWSEWVLSGGKDMVDEEYYDIKEYKDYLTYYDSKWHEDIEIMDLRYFVNNNIFKDVNKNLNVNKDEDIKTEENYDGGKKEKTDNGGNNFTDNLNPENDKFSFEIGDDNINYKEIKYGERLDVSKISINEVSYRLFDEKIHFKLKFNSNMEENVSVFLQGSEPGLQQLIRNVVKIGENTIILKFDVNEYKSYSAGLAINLGERNFVFIEKNILNSKNNDSETENNDSENNSNSMFSCELKDDGIMYDKIDYTDKTDKLQTKVKEVGYKIVDDKIHLKFKFESSFKENIDVFLFEGEPGLDIEVDNGVSIGDNVVILKFKIEEFKNLTTGLVVSLGNDHFILIDKKITDKILGGL